MIADTQGYSDALEEERLWLESKRSTVVDFTKKLEDEKHILGMLGSILDTLEDSLAFNFAEQTAAEAFAVLAQQQVRFASLLTKLSTVEEYRKRREEYVKNVHELEVAQAQDQIESDDQDEGIESLQL